MPYTTIRIDDETRDRLRSMGKMGESYNDVIKRLLETVNPSKSKEESVLSEFSPRRPGRPSDFG